MQHAAQIASNAGKNCTCNHSFKYYAVLHYGVSKASSNFAREEYRLRLRLKRRGVSSILPYGGLLVESLKTVTIHPGNSNIKHSRLSGGVCFTALFDNESH